MSYQFTEAAGNQFPGKAERYVAPGLRTGSGQSKCNCVEEGGTMMQVNPVHDRGQEESGPVVKIAQYFPGTADIKPAKQHCMHQQGVGFCEF